MVKEVLAALPRTVRQSAPPKARRRRHCSHPVHPASFAMRPLRSKRSKSIGRSTSHDVGNSRQRSRAWRSRSRVSAITRSPLQRICVNSVGTGCAQADKNVAAVLGGNEHRVFTVGQRGGSISKLVRRQRRAIGADHDGASASAQPRKGIEHTRAEIVALLRHELDSELVPAQVECRMIAIGRAPKRHRTDPCTYRRANCASDHHALKACGTIGSQARNQTRLGLSGCRRARKHGNRRRRRDRLSCRVFHCGIAAPAGRDPRRGSRRGATTTSARSCAARRTFPSAVPTRGRAARDRPAAHGA